jgi:hypothetical protein
MLIPSVDLEPLPKVYHLKLPIVDHEGRYTSAIDRRSIVRLLYGIDARRADALALAPDFAYAQSHPVVLTGPGGQVEQRVRRFLPAAFLT